jgi:EAL domain-containing protein (putative c-di-GMP-specific phosphodiesterase class I)/CheY-like chemotaxis protein
MSNPIRVTIADDEDAIRTALTSLLSSDPGIVVVGEASDAQGAIELAASLHPAVALLDVRMPEGGGPRAASEITRHSPDTRVIALSALEDADSILEMMDAGADGYVSKADDIEKIAEAIHRWGDDPAALVDARRERAPMQEMLRDTGWIERRRERSERIRAVMQAGGPRLIYQPLIDLTDGRCIGVEALSRFDALPHRAPDKWFAEADLEGLRVEMELIAVRSALDDLDRLDPDAFLSVNVSPVTCCAPELRGTIERSQPERVVLEITEHTPVTDYRELSACLAPLRTRGVRLAIDDTGAGFSSLSHVLGLAPELIKLDIDVCRNIEADETREALVRALADFASHIGADIVAEGIESPAQLFALRDAGVRYGQGFYFGRPQSLPGTGGS